MSQKADIKILVVDDDPLSALMVSEYLRQSGYQVYKTHSGQEALTLLKKQPIDILLTDIMMPKMSGNELTRQVLKIYPDIIAIAITAMNSTHNAVEFMKNGGMDYIQKPFNTDSLVIAIENATKRLQLNRQLKWTNQELIKQNKALAKEIQKRLEIQQSLENSRDNLKSVFDSMNDFVFILDTHGCVLHVNPVVCYQLGFSQKELFGMNILELHAPQKAQDIAHFVKDMLSYTPTLLIGHLLKKNGETIDVETKINHGKWNGKDALIGVSRDVTDYKRVQRNMEAIIEGFQKGEIDAILRDNEVFLLRSETQVRRTEANLKQSEETQLYLTELNQSKDRFFSILGHDLRGMFNSLIVSADMLVKIANKESSNKMIQFASSMKKSTHNAYELLENLLTWSRCQRGIMQVSPVEFDVCQLIQNNIDLFAEKAGQKNIALRADTPDQLIAVADRNIADTILRNLIANALKFTHPNGSIRVFTTEKGNSVHISVEDDGTGIEPENLQSLFQIDSRYKRKGTANEQGTGLGLIMCKELALKNNGEIWAVSEIDKGSTFTFSIGKLIK